MTALLLAAIYVSTAEVQGIAAAGATLWAATGGGVERYDLASGRRVRLYEIGPALQIWSNDQNAQIAHARTRECECVLDDAGARCVPAPPLPPPVPSVAPLFHGARETARVQAAGRTIVATAGQGIWSNDQMLTPPGQLCGNHVEALAQFQGRLWVGAFDGGLCVLEGDGVFRAVPGPFRMVNDLRATARGLYVAAAEGLWFTPDGRRFRRERRIRERAVNRLAAGGRWVFATTPFALYAIRDDGLLKRWRKPAGSTALQSVTVSGPNVWLASEDAGVIRLRRGRFEAYDRAWGLPSSWTVDVAPAPDGGVWAATLRNGSVHLDATGRTVEYGPDPHAWGLRLYDDGGRVRLGTQQGLEGVAPEELPDPHVHAILRTRDGLWLGTEAGLVLLDGATAR